MKICQFKENEDLNSNFKKMSNAALIQLIRH